MDGVFFFNYMKQAVTVILKKLVGLLTAVTSKQDEPFPGDFSSNLTSISLASFNKLL